MSLPLHEWAEVVADQGPNSSALASLMRLCNASINTSQTASTSSNVSSTPPSALRQDASPIFPGVPAHSHTGPASAEALVKNALPLCTYIIRS